MNIIMPPGIQWRNDLPLQWIFVREECALLFMQLDAFGCLFGDEDLSKRQEFIGC